MKKLMNKGFTLVELMVVIVIVGILAAVAIPKFTVASHKAKASEFPTVLSSIYQGEHTYEAETGSFSTDLTGALGVSIPSSKWFSYDATLSGITAFTADAEVTGSGFGIADAGQRAYITDQGSKVVVGDWSVYAPNWTD